MPKTRVHEIDLLRLIAALMVVFFHYAFRGYAADSLTVMPYPLLAPLAKYGHLGVNLFFMISGFVILMTASGGSLKRFIASRIARLYPAFWACCTLTFLLILLIGAPRFSATFSQYLINLSMLSGFVGVDSIDGVYWSLCVELRFYALVAVLLLIRQIDRAQFFLVLWLAASISLEIIPYHTMRAFLITNYAAYFIAGATCFLIWLKGLSPLRAILIIASWLLALYESAKTIPDLNKVYSCNMNVYTTGIIISVFFAIMLLVALKRTGFFKRHGWTLAGALTYPLYLLHQFIGYMVFNKLYPMVNVHLIFWGTLALVLGMAYGVNVGVEKRFAPILKKAIMKILDGLSGAFSRRMKLQRT